MGAGWISGSVLRRKPGTERIFGDAPDPLPVRPGPAHISPEHACGTCMTTNEGSGRLNEGNPHGPHLGMKPDVTTYYVLSKTLE